ncbi:MAG TPA: CaiB/BaiF CoA-transferase family protein [Blastocatellia bacterium]|nr:CaiB/BaiF CoA-transferase family protein [Blastocatellia bacterium]
MENGDRMPGALEGIRVLDLSRLLPGPYASMMLGDLGAEVIKIEDTKTGDPTRWTPPLIGEQSAAFLQVNRNKKSVALDLKHPDGREIFLKMAARADVVLEQFRPGVMDRLGIGYGDLAKVSPRIVYCSLTGYGQDGPLRGRVGHDLNYIALSGVLGLTAGDDGRPAIPGVQIADLAGGMMAALAILAALVARDRTGRGQCIDLSMFDVMMSMLPIPAASRFAGRDLGVGGRYGLNGAYPFYHIYETSDGRFMTLSALEPKFWESFCKRIGREDLIARQFEEGEGRESLFEEMRRTFKSRTQAEWVELMGDTEACCEPVLSLSEAFEHPQARARGNVRDFELPSGEKLKQLGFAYRMSGTPLRTKLPPPALGQHTGEILRELGISEQDRERLISAGVVRQAGAGRPRADGGGEKGTLRISD